MRRLSVSVGLLVALYATAAGGQQAQQQEGGALRGAGTTKDQRDVQLNLPGGISVGVSDSGQVSVQTPWTGTISTGGNPPPPPQVSERLCSDRLAAQH